MEDVSLESYFLIFKFFKMKTLFKKALKLSSIALILTLCMSFTSKKTCVDYYFDNSASSCDVEFDLTITQLPSICNTCLGPNDHHMVAAGQKFRLPCGTCTNQCNITITMTSINGSMVSGTGDFSSTSGASVSGSNFCSFTLITYNPVSKSFVLS